MNKELKRFEKWWDAEDDIPNDGPYTPDTPIQFAWAGWQAALAQPAQQEPVAIALNTGTKQGVKWLKNVEHGESLYTTPPQRKPLTDEDVERIIKSNMSLQMNLAGIRADFEAAHGIKD